VIRRSQYGKVTPSAALLATAVGLASYAAVKYVPIWRDFGYIRTAVAEAGRRAAGSGDASAAKAWFDGRMAEQGLGWLDAAHLFWQNADGGRIDVGVTYEVIVRHPLFGGQILEFAWYCTATPSSCEPFVPALAADPSP
jgi:hypothetical protein